uniref:Uncharacterized protein n=1 Tax=Zonotrichia albicollis TaxID=44394 RepID=A0A8D2MA95_ZONAL
MLTLVVQINKKMMYIYKRPYVHFPMIFLRQNCDHMCIIKILFNPLPMEIFWKKLTLCCVSNGSENSLIGKWQSLFRPTSSACMK